MRLRSAKHNPEFQNKINFLQLIRYKMPECLSVKQPESLDSK
jgi:hypothetical protein